MTKLFTHRSFIKIFSDPTLLDHLSIKHWEQLIRILRGADLLSAFYYFLQRNDKLNQVPSFALKHLSSAKRYADRQAQQLNIETLLIDSDLSDINCPPVFLKGAAYLISGTTNSLGRIMSDIDILVPKEQLNKVENTLKKSGWIEKELDDYDQQYYRKWVHELPPFKHSERGTTLDIHHTIIPPITGITIPLNFLTGEKRQNQNSLLTLSREMMVMHCIVHLFYNEDYEKSFRDILDIELLIEDFESTEPIANLYDTAAELGFIKELYYTFRITDKLFSKKRLRQDQIYLDDSWVTNWFCDNIITSALTPSHDLIDNRWNRFARFIMFLRGHYLKMPLKILLPHLITKTRRFIVMKIMGAHHYEK